MTVRRPDTERRLVPRWRASQEAVNAGEVRSTRPNKVVRITTAPDVPEYEELRAEWKRERSTEVAADLLSCAVSLGRASEREVQEAARLLADSDVSNNLHSVAQRVLAGTLGVVSNPKPISFDSDLARAELQSQIASHKRRVRAYPKNALAWTDLARLYTALGQQEKACAALQVATRLAPENRFVLRAAARFSVHAHLKNRGDHIRRGLDLLRKSRIVRNDPWVMAAEISLSTIANETPGSLKWARSLADEDAVDPWDSSELNGALATLAIKQGGLGKPRKLFNKSLRAPTENALAQAQWAAETHKVITVSERIFKEMRIPAFEALALRYRTERKWTETIKACRAWGEMEPTSARPLMLGGFVAEAALEDGNAVFEFSERALLLAPNAPWAYNNMAVALAYLGRYEEAGEYASRFHLHEVPEEMHAHYIATQGLIAYRRGDRQTGLDLYLKAASVAVAERDVALRAMLMWHLLREEARLRAPGTKELADLLWKRTRFLAVPELEPLYQRIQNPEPTRSERVAAVLKSLVHTGAVVPSVKDVVGEQFRKLFRDD